MAKKENSFIDRMGSSKFEKEMGNQKKPKKKLFGLFGGKKEKDFSKDKNNSEKRNKYRDVF